MKKYLKGQENETAKEALDRYSSYINSCNVEEVEEFREEYYLPTYSNKVDIGRINKDFSEKFGVPLPRSFYKFIEENGFFKFGVFNNYSHGTSKIGLCLNNLKVFSH